MEIMNNISSDSLFEVAGKVYYFDFSRLTEMCHVSSNEYSSEKEITEAYTLNDDNSEMELSSKINREIKSVGNTQNDMIIYDAIKVFLDRIVNSAYVDEVFDVGQRLSFNTLVACGLLVELK